MFVHDRHPFAELAFIYVLLYLHTVDIFLGLDWNTNEVTIMLVVNG